MHNTDLHWPGRGRGCVRVCVCARALVLQRFLDLTSEVVLFKKKIAEQSYELFILRDISSYVCQLTKEIMGISELILEIPNAVKLFKMIQLIQKLNSERKFAFFRPHIITIRVYVWKLIIQLA